MKRLEIRLRVRAAVWAVWRTLRIWSPIPFRIPLAKAASIAGEYYGEGTEVGQTARCLDANRKNPVGYFANAIASDVGLRGRRTKTARFERIASHVHQHSGSVVEQATKFRYSGTIDPVEYVDITVSRFGFWRYLWRSSARARAIREMVLPRKIKASPVIADGYDHLPVDQVDEKALDALIAAAEANGGKPDRKLIKRKRKTPPTILEIPPSIVPKGKSYEWKREKLLGIADDKHMTKMRAQGWRPVPASRHPGLPSKGRKIVHQGAILMERPARLTKEAREEEFTLAREQIDSAQTEKDPTWQR